MSLYCSLCYFTREDAQEAVTVINGQAVCDDHNGYVQGDDHANALVRLRRDQGRRPDKAIVSDDGVHFGDYR